MARPLETEAASAAAAAARAKLAAALLGKLGSDPSSSRDARADAPSVQVTTSRRTRSRTLSCRSTLRPSCSPYNTSCAIPAEPRNTRMLLLRL